MWVFIDNFGISFLKKNQKNLKKMVKKTAIFLGIWKYIFFPFSGLFANFYEFL